MIVVEWGFMRDRLPDLVNPLHGIVTERTTVDGVQSLLQLLESRSTNDDG